MSVFKEADVRLIRAICQRYQDYGVRAFLAHKFETSKTQITRVAKNQMWAHVTVSVDYQLPPGIEAEFKAYYDAACRTRIRHRRDALQGRMTENTKLTDAQVRALFKRRQETGLSYSKLGRAFGVSNVQARYICTGKSRWDVTGLPPVREVKYANQITGNSA